MQSKEFQKALLEGDFQDILGQEGAKQQLKGALVSGRHALIIGPPGVGKTTLAKNVAKLLPTVERADPATKKKKKFLGVERFVRIQGSPDLTVEDILGDIDPIKALKFGPRSVEAFTPGKIFLAERGVLFFDEINRAPEKLQNALLQVLSEGKATLSGYTVDFPLDFLFIGTMNPAESAAVEPLSDVFLDRFDVVTLTYPETLETEEHIVKEKGVRLAEFPQQLLTLTLQFLRELRSAKELEKRPSVRASLGLYERAQAHALINNRTTVTPDDVHNVIVSVLAHRIALKPSHKFSTTPEHFIATQFEEFSSTHEDLDATGGGSLRRERTS